MKILVRVLLALFGLIVVLFLGLWIFIKVQFSDEALTAQVNQTLKESLIRQASVKRVSISLWPPVSLDIEGMTIANRPDSGFTQTKPMLDMKLLSARLDLFDLLQKKLTVEQITSESLYFLLETSEDGKSNLDELMQPAKPEAGEKKESSGFMDDLSFVFNRITVNNLIYEKIDHKGKSALGASGVGLSLTGKTEPGKPQLTLDGDFVVENLRFSNTFGTLVEGLRISGTQTSVFDTEKGSWRFSKLEGKAGDLPLSVTGYMDSLYTPRRYLNLGITAPESDLKAVLGLLSKSITKDVASAKTSGKLKFDMKIDGILSDSLLPGVTINFDLSNGSIQYPKLPKPITALGLSGTVTEKRLDLKHFGASLGTNKVQGSLVVEDYNRKKIDLALFAQLNLAEVGQFYPLEQGTSVAGTVNSDIRVSAVLSDMKSARASGKAEFKKVSARTAQMATPLTNLNGLFLFNNERVELKGLTMQLGDSDIQLDGYAEQYLRLVFSDSTGKGKTPFVSASLRSKNLNIDKLLPEDTAKKAAPTAPKKREQLPNVDGQFSVDIASMTANKITMKDVKGTVKLHNKVLDLSGLGMSVFNGRVGLGGDINLKDINHPVFNLDVDVKELSVPSMLSELPSLDKFAGVGKYLAGNVSLKSKMQGRLNDTLGLDLPSFLANGNFLMQQGQLAGMPLQNGIASALNADNLKSFNFKDWANSFEIKNGRLFVNNLKLNIDGTEVTASGSQGLDKSMDYKLKINLPKSAQAGLQKAIGNFGANLLTDNSGKIPVNLMVGGSLTSPKVTLDKQALISNAKSAAVSQLVGKVTGGKDSTAGAAVETAKKQVEEKVQKETKKLEEKAKDKLKKLFGK